MEIVKVLELSVFFFIVIVIRREWFFFGNSYGSKYCGCVEMVVGIKEEIIF